MKKVIRRAPYNREIVFFNRFYIPYAPAYGWRAWWNARREDS